MAIYFFDKNQTLIKIVPESATFEVIQTQELDDDSLLKDTLSVTVKGDEKLIDAEYMAVKSYKGNAQTFDMYRIVTDTTPDKSMSFTGMSLAPYELNGHIIQDLRPANHSLSYTLNRVLDGTDWRVGYIEDGLDNVTTTFYYVSAKEALKELQSLVGCEFVFKVEISGQKITDKWIEVYSEMGNRTKKRFNYGTNALTVVRETNKADIYTALIGRGKGEEVSSGEDNASGQAGYGRKITFEDIEWKKSSGKPLDKPKGQYYLELPQATQAYGIKNIDGTMKARVGIVDFDDEEDKNRLINLTYQQLLVSSRPKVLFKTTVANIGATGIGDTVTIHRHDLNIHYQTRVRKIVRNKLNDNKTQIELGDAVVTASTKQTKQNNATIKNLNNEIDKIKANVTTSQNSADGKNTIFYGSTTPERQRTGDTWYRPHPSIDGETQMLTWNGTAWELVIDTSDLTSVSRAVEEAAEKADEAVQSAKDADTRAGTAIEKAGANANLLTTHQNTLDTINNTTIPNVNKVASDAMAEAKSAASSAGSAMAEAKSALSSAGSAMDEAKKADGKIADYVTKNGLVSGTTVDTKINDATGEISKKITTVESKIPTEIGGRNLIPNSHFESDIAIGHSAKDGFQFNGVTYSNENSELKVVFLNNGESTSSRFVYWSAGNKLDVQKGEKITLSFKGKVDLENKLWVRTGGTFVSPVTKIAMTSDYEIHTVTFEAPLRVRNGAIVFWLENAGTITFDWMKLELGGVRTDWSPAPEDIYTQSEFKSFEADYSQNVEGITSRISTVENSKVDNNTYTDFYENEYKRTAKDATDAYTAVNRIIDSDGNSTENFAKAVYDKNATRQSADFKLVTDGLVKEATYTAGINGVNSSITTIQGKLDNLESPNLVLDSNKLVENSNYLVASYNMTENLIGGETYTITVWGDFPNGLKVYHNGGGGANHIASTSMGNNSLPFVGNGKYEVTTKVYNGIQQSSAPTFLIYQGRNNTTNVKVRIDRVMITKGKYNLTYQPAPSDMMGKEEFKIFKNDYDDTAKKVERRLTAIDSGKDGSILYKANTALSTAQGNTRSITTLNTKVDGLKIGGRNLISGTDDLTNMFGSGYGGSSIKYYKDYKVEDTEWGKATNATRVVITNASGTSGVFTTANDFKMIFGKPYTVSFYVKNLGQNRIQFSLNGLTLNPDGTGGQSIYVNGGESGKFSATGYMRNNPIWNWFQILAIPASGVTSMDFAIAYLQVEEGNFATDWTPALADQMGKAEFTVFKNDYEETSKGILSRLTAIDSSESGSVVTRLNATEKTAGENKNTISKVNKIVTIQDTRDDNQRPSWYRKNYPKTTVQEFKSVTTIKDSNIPFGSGYGILTTTVVWNDKSGGTVQQVFSMNEKRYIRRGWTDDTGWMPWTKMTDQEDIKNFVDSTSTEYQTITERSNLYERVIGSSSEAGMKQNISRIVMTDSVFQTEVVDRQNLLTAMASGTGMTSDPYFDKGINGLMVYDNGNTGTITIKHEKIPSTTSFPPPKGTDGYRLDIVHAPSTSTSPDRGGIFSLTNGWAGGTVVVKFVALLPTGRSFDYHNNGMGAGYTAGWLTDNKGTGKWETYMYYYRFGTGTVSSFGHLSVDGASTAFTWYLSEYDIINVNETSASKITQLSDNINLKVSKDDISNQININTQGVVIQGHKIALSGDTTVDGTFWTKQVNAVKVNASNITTGTLNASKVKVTNLDASSITGNLTEFIKTNWNQATGGGVTITGSGVRAINSEGSRVTLEDGVVSVGNRAGVNLGFFGDHVLNKNATGTMTITASHGTETAFISATSTDGKTYQRSMSIMAGAGEIDMFTTLDMNKNALKDVTDIGFTGGLIKGNISGSARYMTIDAGTGTSFDIAGTTRMSITSVVNIFSGIDMKGKDIASVGKLTYNSDQRLKTNIKDTNIRALDAIRNWQLVSYDWLESGEHVDIGLIAQNSPEVMTYNDENDIYGIDAGKQTMINTLAIQQLDSKTNDEVAQLKAQIASLQDELATLKGDKK